MKNMTRFPFFNVKKTDSHAANSQNTSSSSLDPYQEMMQIFDGASDWQAQFSKVFLCMNNEDNVPIETKLTKSNTEAFCFMISQSRGGGKTNGQDCIGIAKHKNWECIVLCDGHDKEGHLMSTGICGLLPHIMLRRIHERFPDEIDNIVDDDLIYDAFDEAEEVVAWSNQQVYEGDFVRIAGGQYEGILGYVTGFDISDSPNSTGFPIVSILDDLHTEDGNSFSEPLNYVHVAIEKEFLLTPRFMGGCTCVCIIRNVLTNEIRIATSGDSRLGIYIPPEGNSELIKNMMKDPGLVPSYGTKLSEKTKVPNLVFMTPQHNVFNEEEISRLEEDYKGAYRIDEAFLVNPDTNFMIQPTRGFGDHDMHGTGYTHIPEISNTIILPKDSLIFAASDGVFDDKVWTDQEIVDRLCGLVDEEQELDEITRIMYDETLVRSLQGGYVDDISIFGYFAPDISGIKPKRKGFKKRLSERFSFAGKQLKNKSLPTKEELKSSASEIGGTEELENLVGLDDINDMEEVEKEHKGDLENRKFSEERLPKSKKQKRKTMVRGNTNLPTLIETLIQERELDQENEETEDKLLGEIEESESKKQIGRRVDEVEKKIKKGNKTLFKKITNSLTLRKKKTPKNKLASKFAELSTET
eukprot:snap_masked-scaffold_44-processed-gene-1.76-mRNA-1 protein AED:1.00 eAED:1.00 QI:0/0/0/0/1/1/2/0/638